MTPNINAALSGIFDVALTDTDKPLDVMKLEAKAESIDSLEKQREFVKTNIVKLLEKGTAALDEMLAVAKSTESGKDYAVVKDMIKSLVDGNIALLEVEVAHKNKPPEDGDKPPREVTNNNVFVGSTTDLQKHLNGGSNTVENK